MKKINLLALLMMISCIFAMSACSKPADDSGSADGSTPAAESDAHEEAWSQGGSVAAEGERPLVSLWDYEEYLTYVSEHHLEDVIVTYEDLKDFGEFKELVILSRAEIGDYSHYMYVFKNDSGDCEFPLWVEHPERTISPEALEGIPFVESAMLTGSDVDRTDMRTTNADAPKLGIYMEKNIEYSFAQGKLNYIGWTHDEVEYHLSIEPLDYQGDYPPIVSALLNCDTAPDAVAALCAKIDLQKK